MSEETVREDKKLFDDLAEKSAKILLLKADSEEKFNDTWRLVAKPMLDTRPRQYSSWQEFLNLDESTKWSEVDWEGLRKGLAEEIAEK